MDRLITANPDIAIVSVKVPSNLAILGQRKIKGIKAEFPSVNHWVIGGHSLGGVVSTATIKDDNEAFDGLILLASWAASSYDLSDWDGRVLSLYASNDSLATVTEIEENKKFLPTSVEIDSDYTMDLSYPQTVYWEIVGGNHSGFGCYGFQDGDGDSTIDISEQQDEIIIAISKFLTELWK
jgi:hypothetical protein